MKDKKQYVYLVRQTQTNIGTAEDIYKNETIYVCSTKKEATRRARKLNKEYGTGCIFDENMDFVEVDYDDCFCEDIHYYDVEAMTVDKPMA